METCPHCGSKDTLLDGRLGAYWCQICNYSWEDWDSRDDLNYDEAEIPTEILSDDDPDDDKAF